MALYLTVSRGPRADLAAPVLATSDAYLVAVVLAAISHLGDSDDDRTDPPALRPSHLRLLEGGDEADEADAE